MLPQCSPIVPHPPPQGDALLNAAVQGLLARKAALEARYPELVRGEAREEGELCAAEGAEEVRVRGFLFLAFFYLHYAILTYTLFPSLIVLYVFLF